MSSPGSAVRRVAVAIREIIHRGRIPPGGRLPTEHTLARRFGVSRPMVREAIQTLRALGVVESRPRIGLRVRAFDPQAHFDLLIPWIRSAEERVDLYELRRLLEPAILALVIRRASPADLERLDTLLRRPLPRGRAGIKEGIARDIAFHEELWRLSGNRFVWSLRGLLLRSFADVERRERLTEARVRRTIRLHRAIVRHLKRGHLEAAQQILREHLEVYRP